MSEYPYGVMVVAMVGLFTAIMMARNPDTSRTDVQVAQSSAASPAVQFPATAYGPPAAPPALVAVPSAVATEIPGSRIFAPSPAMNPPPTLAQVPVQPPPIRKPVGIPVQTAVPMPPPPNVQGGKP